MALTKIRGNTQIKTGTITNVEIAANAGIELSKLAQGAELILRDGSVAFTGNVDLGSNQIKNVAAPTDSGDATTKTYVDVADAAVQAAVDAEVLRAQGAESDLSDAIDAEVLRAQGAEEQLSSDLADEAQAREAADLALDGRLTTAEGDIVALEGRMDTAESDIEGLDTRTGALENGLQAETTARQNADLALDGRLTTAEGDIDALEGRMDSAEGRLDVLEDDLAAEVSRAIAAEGVLRTDFDAEVVARAAADSTLQSNINAEAATRAAADTTLQSNINAEAATRAAADTALDERLVKAEDNLAFPQTTLFENNASVYQDARPGIIDPQLRDGWYFKNSVAGQKVNWYVYDGQVNNVALQDFSAYAIVTMDTANRNDAPFLNIYTTKTGTGDYSSWYRSRRTVGIPVGSTYTVGKKYLLYWGTNPNVHTDLPRIALTNLNSVGPLGGSERVLMMSLGSNSGSAVNNVQFVAESLGVNAASYKMEFDFKIRVASQTDLDTEVAARIAGDNTLTSSLNSEISARQAADTTLQHNINSEASARQSADADLQSQIDALESSSGGDISALESRMSTAESDIDSLEARMTTAEGDINTLESGLAQEILDRAAGDSATLASAQSYADQKVSDLVNSAPAVLDTLKELSDALNSDPNFATTVANQIAAVQAEVDAEELARAAADSALQAEIDAEELARAAADSALDVRVTALEVFKDAQTVYVAKNGNDSTGNGGEHKPFLTIQAAMASITDSSPSKRYVIKVKAGAYTETGVLALKPNVFVVGESKDSVRIGATSFAMDASFNQASSFDNRSGFANATLLNACDFNWQTVSSPAGKLYFNEVQFSSTVALYGHNNAIAQAQFHGCLFFGAFTVSGINVGVHKNNIHYSNITLNQHPNGGMATILAVDGGTCSGTVTLNATTDNFGRRCSMFARSFYMEYLTVNGPSAYCDLTDNSVPRDIARVTKSNGGNIVYINTLSPIDSNSRNIGEPGKQYLYNFNYVNASTGTDLYVISMGTAYSADSSGKSIFIEADSYGLNADVNGGDINVATAAVSGTGVRGKIKLDGREVDVNSKKIVNLANGVADNDAVNVSQLNASVSSLNAADSALAARLDTAEADIVALEGRMDTAEGDINTLEVDLAAEVARATGAEASLASDLADEEAARIAADSALQGNIDAEETRALAAEALLDGRLTTAEGDIVALEGRMDTAESDIAALESSVLYVSKVVTRETPAGAVDASNVEFVLANSIVLGSEQVFLNGLLQEPGIGNDYLISGSTITFNNAPQVNDRIRVSYLKA